ncbi:hypothetical protein FW778_15860 [Ginsengibacter hankyongi]|uniref:Alpha/beta hydrolase n=1 Tax=Ginsengibacter hankyongi TaxID=2607284 RepID=A0A5J5IFD3_9BACT|nr:hypothetical protein [Ginsengibacter hankyongi]KAA9037569.1 hypothetical protein FW778_15860 [Ginsengibacter hankyongi]
MYKFNKFYIEILLITFSLLKYFATVGQLKDDSIYSFSMQKDVRITIDAPANANAKKTILILYALPNGNTTEQTMGKKIKEGDDWHFDIQHIRAQTRFIRTKLRTASIVVAYLENSYKSWPLWKTKHHDYAAIAKQIVDTLYNLIPSPKKVIYLGSHSGGGRFIFSYLDAVTAIPSYVQRIIFLDSDYGYDSSYLPKLKSWIKNDKKHVLNVFAYNDSVALYNGKTFVSGTGGTWYRSHLMLTQLSSFFNFKKTEDDSLVVFKSANNRIQFYLKTNPDKKIYHTTQVELNGFIHSVLSGTKYDSKGYRYFGKRAYSDLIE